MKLTDAELKKTLTIIEVDDCEYTQKLSVLGFVSGCRVCPLMDLSGTLLIDIKGCHYAMSQEIVEHINVEETKENGYES
jgi:Fe2+ transport system protein FeoA